MSLASHLAFLSWQTPLFNWSEFQCVVQAPEFAKCADLYDLKNLFLELNLPHALHEFVRSADWRAQQARYHEWLIERRVQLLYPGHPDYPTSYFNLEEPPLALAYWGTPCWKGELCLAVVGSREPQPESLAWMEQELGDLLARFRLVTVSGGARGIDQKCHALSLRAGRPTVVAVPSGLNRLYPRDLCEWVEPVLAGGGAFISCFAPDQVMYKSHFRRRNQLIAQLGQTVLIVEAGRRSGTFMTARLASQREMNVGVIPGHPFDNHFQGSLDLIHEGMTLIRDAKDLELLMGGALAPRALKAPGRSRRKHNIRHP